MPYLIKRDYSTYIQADYLRQLTQADDDKRIVEENTTVQVILQRLQQKYDLNLEFTNTAPYDRTKVYGVAERAVIDIAPNGFSAWTASTSYVPGSLVINAGLGYICITANTDTTFTATNWQLLGAQYAIFYVLFPIACTVSGQPNPATLVEPFAPMFSYKNAYSVGDVVYWRGYTYVCKQASSQITQQAALQYQTYNNIPFSNVFPDDPIANANGQYWTNKTAYAAPAGSLFPAVYDTTASYAKDTFTSFKGNTYQAKAAISAPAGAFDANKWTQVYYWGEGDNRNQTIKDAMVRITIFKLSPLIAPKNRPDVWLEDYRSMMRELNEAGQGLINMTLPPRQPQTGLKTYGGSEVKRQNNY